MSKMKYALEEGGPKRLEISWKGNWKELTVRVDGNTIGSITDCEQLKAGQEFLLKDGSIIKVQLTRRSIFPFLQVLKDGQVLPSPGPGPAQRLSIAYKLIFLIGGVNLAIGLAGAVLHTAVWSLPPAGLRSVAVGCVFLALGFFVMRRSTIALTAAMGVLALDVVLAVVIRQDLPRDILIVGIIFRILVLLAIAQGFGAIRDLNRSQCSAK